MRIGPVQCLGVRERTLFGISGFVSLILIRVAFAHRFV